MWISKEMYPFVLIKHRILVIFVGSLDLIFNNVDAIDFGAFYGKFFAMYMTTPNKARPQPLMRLKHQTPENIIV